MPAMGTAATDREDVIERCGRAEAEIRSLGVRRIALFGSLARGEADADSDADLLVEFEPGGKSFDHFLALADLLERLLGRRVDLVTIEALSPYIGPHILAEAEDVLRAA
jgi:predicted nucleotidyltransferase